MTDDRSTPPDQPTRRPDPEAAAQDPENARRQAQLRADHDALQEQARRVESSTPADIRGKTVEQIVEDSDRKADR